jgi:hypothetical protein
MRSLYLAQFKLKSRCKWFSSPDKEACEGWFGPCPTMEDALVQCLAEDDYAAVYICQGSKMSKQEQEESDMEFSWNIDSRTVLEIKVHAEKNNETN